MRSTSPCTATRISPPSPPLFTESAHDPGAGPLPLSRGACLGTASARRRALVRDLRPDLELALLRGNVPTRVKKLRAGEFDAVLLAGAGLCRLDRAAERGEGEAPSRAGLVEVDLDPELFVPAPSQGALALQVRSDDPAVSAAVAALDDVAAHRAVRAERALLGKVDAGCQVPFGAHCSSGGNGELELVAALEVDGELRRARARGDDPLALANEVFPLLLGEGERAR